MQKIQTVNNEQEFDVTKILGKIWESKYFIIKSALAMAIIGVFVAILTPNSYTAHSIFVPKSNNPSRPGSSLTSLAALAGFDLPNMTIDQEITPLLYPKIIASIPFRQELLKSYITHKGEKIILIDYLQSRPVSFTSLIKSYTIGLPYLIKDYLTKTENTTDTNYTSTGLIKLTDDDDRLFQFLENTIDIMVDKKGGFISISVSHSDPIVSATLATNAQTLLQKYIIEFKRKSAQDNLTFIQTLFQTNKSHLEGLQDDLANFSDQNQNISSGLYLNQISRMASNVTISQTVVQELAKQLEQAKIQVNRNTPVFTIIEPIVIPNQRSKPNRTLIVIAFIFSGIIFSATYILVLDQLRSILNKILKETTHKNHES